MKAILLKNATVIDAHSPYHQETVDVLIENGIVSQIGKINSVQNADTYDLSGKSLSPGFVDIGANFCDPGMEHKEDIQSGIRAAAAGGITTIALSPQTIPPVDNKSAIEYILSQSKNSIVNVLPLGSISEQGKGENLAELYDMHLAGAVAFSEGFQPVSNPKLLLKALQYTQVFNGIVIDFPLDSSLKGDGVVAETSTSTRLGLKPIPAIAEEIQVTRDIHILNYTGGQLHLLAVTAPASLHHIQQAKQNGLCLTASVTAYNLYSDAHELMEFDTNFKVLPPLQNKETVSKLKNSLKQGIIDCIVSAHTPQDIESKKKEFDLAEYGMIGLQTFFPLVNTALKEDFSLWEIIEKIAINPRKVLDISIPSITKDSNAEFTIFNPDEPFVLKEENILSKSKNTPYIHTPLTGKVYGIINNGKIQWN